MPTNVRLYPHSSHSLGLGVVQGCPIGIPKNPEISGSSRKSSLGAAGEVHSARAKYRESRVESGGGGGSRRTQYEKIRRFVQK